MCERDFSSRVGASTTGLHFIYSFFISPNNNINSASLSCLILWYENKRSGATPCLFILKCLLWLLSFISGSDDFPSCSGLSKTLNIVNSRSHIDGVSWLIHNVVRSNVGFHGLVTVAIFGVNKLTKVCRTRAVDLILMLTLDLLSGVAEHTVLAILHLLSLLRCWKASIKHVLVVLNKAGVTTELVIEFVLSVGQNVSLITHSCRVGCSTVWLGTLVVLSQVRVEGTVAVSGTVVAAQSTWAIGDVSVATTSVVHVHDRLGVNVSHVMLWALLQESKCA